jgi:hypothetical protein
VNPLSSAGIFSLPRFNPIFNFQLGCEVSKKAIRRARSNYDKQTLKLLVFEKGVPCGIVMPSVFDIIIEVFDGRAPQDVPALQLIERYVVY